MSWCISTSPMGLPRIRALPAVGKISPISNLMVVDLPAPFGPIKPNTSPISTCMLNPSSEVLFLRCKKPKGYSLVRSSISIAGSGMYSLFASRSSPSMFQHKHVHGVKIQRRQQPDQVSRNQESPRACPICTSSSCGVAGGVIGIGLKFCRSRQLSSIPTCCTQETVHRGAQNFLVEYSRWRISGVYCDNGIPGYPRCCEHQCTRPSSQIYRYREPERHRQLCSLPRATLC